MISADWHSAPWDITRDDERSAKSAANDTVTNLGFESKLWLAADKLRNNMDAAEYKQLLLRLIFLKYISDAFEEMHSKLIAG